MQNAKCKMQNQERIVLSNVFTQKAIGSSRGWRSEKALAVLHRAKPSKAERSSSILHFAFYILHFFFSEKRKKRPFVSGRKDAVPPDFAFSTKSKMRSSTSDNGLTRRKLTGMLPCFISTGSRATDQPFCKDLHQPSSLWAEA